MWYNRFKEGRKDVNVDARPGRSSTSITNDNIEEVKTIIIILERILIMLTFGSAHAKQFLQNFVKSP